MGKRPAEWRLFVSGVSEGEMTRHEARLSEDIEMRTERHLVGNKASLCYLRKNRDQIANLC